MNETPHRVTRSHSAILKAIESASREPFAVALADGLLHAPSPDAWHDFAERSPDKWAASMRSLGELAGYSVRSGADAADVLHELANLVEVLDKRSNGAQALQDTPQPPVIEGELVEPMATPNEAPGGSQALKDASPLPRTIGADGWP